MRRFSSFLRVGIDYLFGLREYRVQEASRIDCVLAIVERDEYPTSHPVRAYDARNRDLFHLLILDFKPNTICPPNDGDAKFKLGHYPKSHSENKFQFTHGFGPNPNPAAVKVSSSVSVWMMSIAPRMSKSFRTA
jgi:hypothetical protein